jgi:uncharacterized glyoxalase superfamily protein PhnB
MATVFPSLYCLDKPAYLAWLEAAFGFETSMVVTNADGALGHCESSYGGVTFNIEGEWAGWTRAPASLDGANTQSLSLQIDEDLDAHCARARVAGGRILEEPEDQWYGHRLYSVADPEGHVWRFSKVLRRMTQDEMAAAGGRPIRSKL